MALPDSPFFEHLAGVSGTAAYKRGRAAGDLAARAGFARNVSFAPTGVTTLEQEQHRQGWWDGIAIRFGFRTVEEILTAA